MGLLRKGTTVLKARKAEAHGKMQGSDKLSLPTGWIRDGFFTSPEILFQHRVNGVYSVYLLCPPCEDIHPGRSMWANLATGSERPGIRLSSEISGRKEGQMTRKRCE